MARIFITGSSDGLGLMAAQLLQSQGHQVVLHARNEQRGNHALSKVPGAEKVLTADLANPEETKKLAAEVNALGSFDAVIHNAGVHQASGEVILAVNTLAPYILTCLIQKPKRLIYMSSNLHVHGDPELTKMTQGKGGASYADSKLHDIILCMAVARLWTGVYAAIISTTRSINPIYRKLARCTFRINFLPFVKRSAVSDFPRREGRYLCSVRWCGQSIYTYEKLIVNQSFES